jgi:single-strand DNA-binding protein
MSINIYTVTGRLGRDPELKFTDGGVAIMVTALAVGHRKPPRVEGEEWTEITTWYDLKAFGALAESAVEELSKGDLVIVVGRVEPVRTFEKKDGTIGTAQDFIANEIGKALTSYNKAAGRAPKRTYNEEPF